MTHATLLARIYVGNGKSRYVRVLYSKNHRPIAVDRATYYLRPGSGDRTPIRVGKDLDIAFAEQLNFEKGQSSRPVIRTNVTPIAAARLTLSEAAERYITRSRQMRPKTYNGYRNAVNLFTASCKKTYFDEISRDDLLDFKYFLQRHYVSPKTSKPIGESTVFNYFLKTMVFLNDCGIWKYVKREDWMQKKDWPVNVDKRNKSKKYAIYAEAEMAAMLSVADVIEEALTRFLVGKGFRIGEAAVAQWKDIDWKAKTISVRFKPEFKFKPKDWEERTIAVSDALLDCLKKYRRHAAENGLIFPSPVKGVVDKHLDRIVLSLINKANLAGYPVKKPKKPCHAFRVLYATRRHQQGVDIETLRDELGHSEIGTTQLYLRSTNTKSDKHRARINKADQFEIAAIA